MMTVLDMPLLPPPPKWIMDRVDWHKFLHLMDEWVRDCTQLDLDDLAGDFASAVVKAANAAILVTSVSHKSRWCQWFYSPEVA